MYRALAARFPRRSPKSFELKFQNISAVLYEEHYPFVDGLLPRNNYQKLLKLIVWDHLKRAGPAKLMPWEILVDRLRKLYVRGLLAVESGGTGRFGLALERHLGIPPNNLKDADFMGIELKSKNGATLQTLFSRVPSRFVGCRIREDLLQRFGRYDPIRGRRSLYTSFGCRPDAFGFALLDGPRCVRIVNGKETVLEYDYEALEAALLSKHSETAYIAVVLQGGGTKTMCRFPELLYCKHPSILRFLRLLRDGRINLDFTLFSDGERIKDHGFLWRIDPRSLRDLYLQSREIDLTRAD